MSYEVDVASHLARLAASYETLARQGQDMEQRLRRLERFQYLLMGGSAVLSVIFGVLTHFLHY